MSLRRRLLSSRLLCTANIKALRGSLGALSVNKLSHIPKLQSISAVYKKTMMSHLVLCTYRVMCP